MRLHVHRFGGGTGTPVLCLHGVQGSGLRFRRLAAAAFPGRPVHAPDLRGHGHSLRTPPWSIETQLDDLRRTLDAAGLGTVDAVGFSFGGRLALELAAADPGRIGRIALLDPAVMLAPEHALDAAETARDALTFADEDAAVDARMATLAHAERDDVAADLAGTLVAAGDGRVGYAVTASAVVAAYGEMARPPRLPRRHPTLMVRAADGIVDDRQEALLREAVDDLTVIVVPGTHAVMWDAFDRTAGAVRAHLET